MTLADKMTEYAHLKATVLPERDRLKASNAELLAALIRAAKLLGVQMPGEKLPALPKSAHGRRGQEPAWEAAIRAAIAKAQA